MNIRKNVLSAFIILFMSVFLVAGNALALPYGLGTEITVPDGIVNTGNASGEDDEVEGSPDRVAEQVWDLEAMYWDAGTSVLSIIGGFNFEAILNNVATGDVFIGNSAVIDLAYDYDPKVNGITHTFEVFTGGFTSTPTPVYTGGTWQVPYAYASGGTSGGGGSALMGATTDLNSYLSNWGGPEDDGESHYYMQLKLDGFSNIVGMINSGELVHFTMSCGNDVIHGSVPEPATMLLLGTLMIGLAVIGRKKIIKTKRQ